MNTHAHILDEAEAVRAEVERALSPELRNRIVNAGFALTVSSLSAFSVRSGQKPVVTVDERLEDKLIEEEIISEMPAFRKKTTGVDNTIFISAKVPRHVPRIKVAINPPTHLDRRGDNAAVAIADGSTLEGDVPPWLGKQVKQFLDLNRDVLIDYWEQRIDDDELRDRLRSIAT
jgi:hypothetical protein